MTEAPHERLKRIRKSRGMSLQDLADAVGMSKAHLHQLEKPGRLENMSYANLCTLAATLGLSVHRLMDSSASETSGPHIQETGQEAGEG